MMTTIPEDPAAPQTLTDRWADADAKADASLIAPLSHVITARDRRMDRVADYLAAFSGQRRSSQKHEDISNAVGRLARAGTLPLAGPLEAELRHVSAIEAADFVRDHKHAFPGDAESEYWIAEAVQLAKLCEVRSNLDNAGRKLDAGQSLEDISPILSDLQAAAEPTEPSPTILSFAINAVDQLSDPEPMAEAIISGGLRRGEIGLWTGATKTAKSWSIMHWHCAIAAGVPCFGYECRRGNGLLIDGELAKPTIIHRLRKVADQYVGIDLSGLKIVPLRETPMDIDGLLRLLHGVQPGQFDFVTIDPIFKLLPAAADENNNAFIASFFTKLIVAATRLDCSILCVHHQSKGNQASKSVADLGSGAGAQSRAVDWHCGIREHAEAGCVSLHTICRSFPPTDPSVWELKPPTMAQRFDLDAEDLKSPKPRRKSAMEPKPERPAKPNWETIAKLGREEPQEAAYFAAETGLSEKKTRELLSQAVAKKRLFLWRDSARHEPDKWASVPARLVG